MIDAVIVADSINPHGCRITTFELTMPKQLLAQYNTHGMIRRVAESSRARPTKGIMQQVRERPYLPPVWNYRQQGMQPAKPMSPDDSFRMTDIEAHIRRTVLAGVKEMEELGAAKEDINRYLEPWMWAKVVTTATTWENYFTLRAHGDAQSAHRILAEKMKLVYGESQPILRDPQEAIKNRYTASAWHLPYISEQERYTSPPTWLPLISARRISRVSYGRQGADDETQEEAVKKCLDLIESKHWSPLDQPARSLLSDTWIGPLQGWFSLRKHYAGESGTMTMGTQEDIQPWSVRTMPSYAVKSGEPPEPISDS
jgi:hypothetical protein